MQSMWTISPKTLGDLYCPFPVTCYNWMAHTAPSLLLDCPAKGCVVYGKLALAMMAQAATYQLRKKLKAPYRSWDAKHLASEVLAWADGDVRVKDDTIIVTFYQAPKHINPTDSTNLPAKLQAKGIDPRIPWLYNFKLDFRFK